MPADQPRIGLDNVAYNITSSIVRVNHCHSCGHVWNTDPSLDPPIECKACHPGHEGWSFNGIHKK